MALGEAISELCRDPPTSCGRDPQQVLLTRSISWSNQTPRMAKKWRETRWLTGPHSAPDDLRRAHAANPSNDNALCAAGGPFCGRGRGDHDGYREKSCTGRMQPTRTIQSSCSHL